MRSRTHAVIPSLIRHSGCTRLNEIRLVTAECRTPMHTSYTGVLHPGVYCAEMVVQVVPTKVRLTRKLAEVVNGIDLSGVEPGDEMELSTREAAILIAEGWATPIAESPDDALSLSTRRVSEALIRRNEAADKPARKKGARTKR